MPRLHKHAGRCPGWQRTAGTEEGGAAAVVTTGGASTPLVLDTIKRKGAKYTSSFEEEKQAMLLALDWAQRENRSTDFAICTDSLSLLMAIDSFASDTKQIRQMLESLNGRVTLQWVPGHSKIPGNELADKAAKEAAKLQRENDDPAPISFSTAKALIKRSFTDPPTAHALVKNTYKDICQKTDHKVLKSRKDAAWIAQMRSGHCNDLAAYRYRIGKSETATCARCEEDDETVIHWLTCPAGATARQSIFGRVKVDLGTFTSDPEKILALAKATSRC